MDVKTCRKLLSSPDCVFDASLVPETCLGRFVDFKGLTQHVFWRVRVTGKVPHQDSTSTIPRNQDPADSPNLMPLRHVEPVDLSRPAPR